MTALVAEVGDGGLVVFDASDEAGAPVAVTVTVGRIVGAFSEAGRMLGVAFVYHEGGKVESFVFARSR